MCPTTVSMLFLSDQIKEHIMANRIVQVEKCKVQLNEVHALISNTPTSSRPASKKKIPAVLRDAVWDTYVGPDIATTTCLCCDTKKMTQRNFHCGHVVAEFDGGNTNLEYLRPICSSFNLSMGTQNMFEFKEKYFSSKVENPAVEIVDA
jgi:hypothetical protein